MPELKIGDVVTGNRHSMRMTVHEIRGKEVDVVYFDDHNNMQHASYAIDDLTFIS